MALLYKTPGLANVTTAVTHIYANGSTGSDNNDGLSVGTPKATLAAAVAMIPQVLKHNTVLHLAGSFTLSAKVLLSSIIDYGVKLLVDGGPDMTVLAGPYTADIHTNMSVGLSSLTMTVDQYKGYYVEILSGPCAGETATIVSNSATTIVPIYKFSADPGLCSFRVSRPATMLSGASGSQWFYGACGGGGQLMMQRMSFGDYLYVGSHTGTCQWTQLMSIVHTGNKGLAFLSPGGKCSLASGYYDPANPDTYASSSSAGVSVTAGSVTVDPNVTLLIYMSVLNTLTASRATVDIAYGFRIKQITFKNVCCLTYYGITATSADYQSKIDGSSGVGIILQNGSMVNIVGAVDISNHASHAIECDNSQLKLYGAVTGTGNTGAGVYAHDGSVVKIKDGSPPTLTGTIGNLSVADPAFSESTWADVDSGNPVAVVAEMTLVKEVA